MGAGLLGLGEHIERELGDFDCNWLGGLGAFAGWSFVGDGCGSGRGRQ